MKGDQWGPNHRGGLGTKGVRDGEYHEYGDYTV